MQRDCASRWLQSTAIKCDMKNTEQIHIIMIVMPVTDLITTAALQNNVCQGQFIIYSDKQKVP